MKTILITRPITTEFIQDFQTAGYELKAFPTFVIQPCAPSLLAFDPKKYDAFIFFSPHAVAHAPASLQQLVSDYPVFAVGASTAEALKAAGFTHIDYPRLSASSESLLKLAALQNVRNLRILLIQGAAGREIVFHTLKERGALVEQCIVYQRQAIALDVDFLKIIFKTKTVAALIVTNQTSLDDLHRAVASTPLAKILCQTPLIVISERLKIAADAKGHLTVLISNSLASSDLIYTVNYL